MDVIRSLCDMSMMSYGIGTLCQSHMSKSRMDQMLVHVMQTKSDFFVYIVSCRAY
jgi:hypothetical protein